MKILRLTAENVKRLSAVEIAPDPDGNLVIIGGRNAQGKTSVLDSIMIALDGKAIPEKPIRKGTDKAVVTLDLGDLVATRTITEKGGTLKVTKKDGTPVAGPQTILNSLISSISFDLLEFAGKSPKEQAAILRSLVGLDLSEQDGKYAKLFEQRRVVNREVARLEGVLSQRTYHSGPGCAELVNTVDVAKEIESETEMTRKYNEAQQNLNNWKASIKSKKEQIAELEARLASMKEGLKTDEHTHDSLEAKFNKMHPGETAELQQRLMDAEITNQKFRDNEAYAVTKDELETAQTESAGLTMVLEKIIEQKEKLTKAAKFPVPGLGFGEDGVLLNGLPFEQASGAERLRASVAIGAALNPKLKVSIVRDGSLLDDDNLKLLAESAAEHDVQVWIERVGSHDESAIIIEDGMVQE